MVLPENLNDFYKLILEDTILSLKVNMFVDNFDYQRYPNTSSDELVFNLSERAFYFDWFFSNYTQIYDAYLCLTDEYSRILYIQLIKFRLGSYLSVIIGASFTKRIDAELERYMELEEQSKPSEINTTGLFGNLRHFDFEYEGYKYKIDCLGLSYYLFRKQYFYDLNGVKIEPQKGDFVIDGGACLGDSAVVFSNYVGNTGKVFAFDPVQEHLDILKHNANQAVHKNIIPMPYGLSNVDVIAEPIRLNGYHPGFRADQQKTPLIKLDTLCLRGEISKIDFIKLDVEGFEYNTLEGAKYSIIKFKPKLAISLYHKPNDIFELILYIRKNYPFYKLYLEHYTIHSEETVLYCDPS